MKRITLAHAMFKDKYWELYKDDNFKIETYTYSTGVEALKISNNRGYLTVLPYYGLIIWDAVFDGIKLKEKDGFTEPHYGKQIADTYGAFEFTSGLLGNRNPAPDDTHVQHGEFATAHMDHSFIELGEDTITVKSDYEYIKGFGDHYHATPSVTIHKSSGLFDIRQHVKNLSKCNPMTLQYMCHLCYAYKNNATLTSNIPDNAFMLRTSIPAHVHPTPTWIKFTDELKKSGKPITNLDDPNNYNPEIVFFTKDLRDYVKEAEFRMKFDKDHEFLTRFDTKNLPIVTRWILYNADQQVAAFALPGTSTPEGRNAAKKAGTLIMLKPQETIDFHVITGLEK